MFPLDPKHFMVVGFFNSWVSFYLLLKNQNWTLKVHKYLILQRKVWLSRWGVRPTHDLKHFMATLPCKSHRWQKPSCILKCFVTFLTPESNFSCGRLSQRYVLTNPYRSGSKGWHSCPSPFLFPPWKSGARANWKLWASGTPSNSTWNEGRAVSVFWSRQTEQERPVLLRPHGLRPRAILDANFHFKWMYKDRAIQLTITEWTKSPFLDRGPDVPSFLPVPQVKLHASGPLDLTLWDPKSLSIWHLS